MATTATLQAADQVVLDAPLSITWTGPNNPGDFITVVAADAPDGQYGPYALTSKGSPLTVTVPSGAGKAEIRYMTEQQNKVLARRPLTIVAPEVTLSGPAEVVAGAMFSVTWSGPAHEGDYVTVVPKAKPDGPYANYTTTSGGSPLKLKAIMEPGDAELRYMTGRGSAVLARRSLRIIAADVALSAPPSAPVNSAITVTWTGPANEGDYITIVPRSAPEGQYLGYAYTTAGSPLTITALKTPGEAEIRYISGQGTRVLARRPITITP